MLIVQKFHSIHEIDPEFIANIETLLQEDVPNFDTLIQKHDEAPATDVFTYFLFFGPTQNAPIGFAQLTLRQIPWQRFLPWWRRLMFWRKDHLHWKQVTWQLGDGSHGLYVMDSRFSRTGKEKMLELIHEYEARPDVMACGLYCMKGLQDFQLSWEKSIKWGKEAYVLEPLTKAFKSYQDYLLGLGPEVRNQIKSAWKTLHKTDGIKLGDYPTPAEAPKALPLEPDVLKLWAKWGAQVLTFEKDCMVLGCLLVLKGKNGNVFFEPFLFEPEADPLVNEMLYTQYALLKFFEMADARKCHLMRFGAKLFFEDKSDLLFFQDQGFQFKTILQSFNSRLKGLDAPV